AALVSIPAPPSEVNLPVLEVLLILLERAVRLIDHEADAELGPSEQCGAASGAQVAALLPRHASVGFHHERDVPCPDRVECTQYRGRLVVGLDSAGRDLVQRPDEHNVRLVLVDQVMDRGQVTLLRDVERDAEVNRAYEGEQGGHVSAETL